MTIKHAAALCFDDSLDAAQKRISKLRRAGYLSMRPRRASEPAVLYFNRKSYDLLAQHDELRDYPSIEWSRLEKRARVSPLTIAHELDVMSVKAAFTSAISRIDSLQLIEFTTWSRLIQFYVDTLDVSHHGKRILIKPDGLISLSSAGGRAEDTFYLEVDRSTERQCLLAQRAVSYREFYRSGGMARRRGSPASDYDQFPFRVLLVFRTAERRNNTAESLLRQRPPLLRQAWLSTMEEVTRDPLGPIWVRPIDYRNATENTSFAPRPQPQSRIYRRNPAREAWVEKTIAKHTIL